jgi:Xaa-Pro aminopeptidase
VADDRLELLRTALDDAEVDALLVGPSADLRYLVGYHALPLERLTMLIVPASGPAALVVPELEAPRAVDSGAGRLVDIVTFTETEDPFALVAAHLGAPVDGPAGGPVTAPTDGPADGHRHGRLAVSDRLWASFLLHLQARLPGHDWVPGSEVMRALRLRKSTAEIDALREVGAAIDRVHERVPSLLRAGRSEAEVGRDIAELILEEHEEVNFVIVASGPNGASPHHETGERILAPGDAVVVDIGGTRNGYCSDMTRNYVVEHAPEGYDELHRVLEEAQRLAVEAVRPGVSAESIDRVARDHLEAHGYGRYFVHRTGHGIGVEEHEEPWIVAGNDLTLEPGMAFSVEPGIYVPDRYGARIEDIVVVTEDGVENLNRRPHGIIVAG